MRSGLSPLMLSQCTAVLTRHRNRGPSEVCRVDGNRSLPLATTVLTPGASQRQSVRWHAEPVSGSVEEAPRVEALGVQEPL